MGWPPVRSYRKNNLPLKKPKADALGTFVKVSMDGAPYLRKINLKQHNSYPELLKALEKLFNFCIGKDPRIKEHIKTIIVSQFVLLMNDFFYKFPWSPLRRRVLQWI